MLLTLLPRTADGEAGEGVHGAVADAQGTHDVDSGSHAAAAHVHGDVGEGAHDDTEAERTLTSGNLSKRAADSDETDTSDSAISSESLDALDDAADDDVDEDELSADGHVSRELVAAPRDIDD